MIPLDALRAAGAMGRTLLPLLLAGALQICLGDQPAFPSAMQALPLQKCPTWGAARYLEAGRRRGMAGSGAGVVRGGSGGAGALQLRGGGGEVVSSVGRLDEDELEVQLTEPGRNFTRAMTYSCRGCTSDTSDYCTVVRRSRGCHMQLYLSWRVCELFSRRKLKDVRLKPGKPTVGYERRKGGGATHFSVRISVGTILCLYGRPTIGSYILQSELYGVVSKRSIRIGLSSGPMVQRKWG